MASWPPTLHQDVQDELTPLRLRPGLVVQQPASTKYLVARLPGSNVGAGFSTTPPDGWATALPLVVSANCTVDRIGCGWHAVGGAGSVARLGLYADDGNYWPGALITDAGTVDTSTGSIGNVTISQALAANRVYWVCIALQGAAASRPNIKMGSGANAMSGMNPAAGQMMTQDNLHNGDAWWSTTITGALPATFPARTAVTSYTQAPNATLRVV